MNSFRLYRVLTDCALFFAFLSAANASVRDIHRDALPQTPAVLQAYQALSDLEPIVSRYPARWNASITQKNGTSQLNATLKALTKAQKDTPHNVELLLLIGLAAHYAYNIDIPNSWDISVSAYKTASELAASDPRPPWFEAVNLCQSSGATVQGMQMMLSIELNNSSAAPSDFWVDYAECAYLTRMPAHAARALEHIDTASFPTGAWHDSILKHIKESLSIPDNNATYGAEVVWQRLPQGIYTSRLCGISFRAQADWQVQPAGAKDGSCTIGISVGPYQGVHRKPSPTLFIIVREPETGESLQDFYTKLTSNPKYQLLESPTLPCPTIKCLAAEKTSMQTYPDEGGGHFLEEIFAANQPAFPGLRFEHPIGPSTSAEQNVLVYPQSKLQRYQGQLYYAILLDTTASVYNRAKADYLSFLKGIEVDQP